MKLGEIRTTTEICKEQECEVCGEPAKYQHTFLLQNARSNPCSSAYRKDDCSWCSDEDKYACEEHKEEVRRDTPGGMSPCATFPRNERFEHLFLYWGKQ